MNSGESMTPFESATIDPELNNQRGLHKIIIYKITRIVNRKTNRIISIKECVPVSVRLCKGYCICACVCDCNPDRIFDGWCKCLNEMRIKNRINKQ